MRLINLYNKVQHEVVPFCDLAKNAAFNSEFMREQHRSDGIFSDH